MILNIGPWWLYDLIAFTVIIGAIAFGFRRGFLVTFYILGLQIIALIINLFIPTLLTNLINPLILNLIRRTGLIELANVGASQIGTVFNNLLRSLTQSTDVSFSWDGLGEELIKVLTATIIFYSFSIIILILVNLIGLIIYKTAIKRHLRKLKILGPADAILGIFNGFVFGVLFSVYYSTVISLPIFATETQRISVFDFDSLTEEQKVDWARKGNSFNRNSLSKKISFRLPSLSIGRYIYSNACVQKYLIDPAMVMATQYMNQNQSGNVFEEIPASVFDVYAELMLEGYVSNNPLNAPISTCIQLMPEDSRTLLRTIAEIMLITPRSLLISSDVNVSDIQSSVTSIQILNAFEEFREANEIDVDYNQPNSFMTLERFRQFYRWTEQNNVTNPFIIGADYFDKLANENNYNSDRRLAQILRDPTQTYSLFRNIFFVNKITNANPNVPVFAPSAWSNIFIAQSMELTFNGQLLGNLFNRNITNNWSQLNLTSRQLLTNSQEGSNPSSIGYNGFWLQYYLDFANLT